MNVRRGLFRLWLLATVIYSCAVVAVAASHWPHELQQRAFLLSSVEGEPEDGPREWEVPKYQNTHYTFQFPNNVTLLVKNVDEEKVKLRGKAFYEAQSAPRDSELRDVRFNFVGVAAVILLLPPLLLFAFGAALIWAFSGFRNT